MRSMVLREVLDRAIEQGAPYLILDQAVYWHRDGMLVEVPVDGAAAFEELRATCPGRDHQFATWDGPRPALYSHRFGPSRAVIILRPPEPEVQALAAHWCRRWRERFAPGPQTP